MQALFKLQEPKAVLKVRKEDLSIIKDVLEPIKSKFTEARAPYILLSLPIVANSDLLHEASDLLSALPYTCMPFCLTWFCFFLSWDRVQSLATVNTGYG